MNQMLSEGLLEVAGWRYRLECVDEDNEHSHFHYNNKETPQQSSFLLQKEKISLRIFLIF